MAFTPDKLQKNVALRDYVTFKLGGVADFFYKAFSTADLICAIEYAKSSSIPFFLLGGGSNLVVSDAGVDGIVIQNCIKEKLEADPTTGEIEVSSGYSLQELIDVSIANGLGGLHHMTGIPGTVGGAIYGNAGAYGRSVSNLLVKAEVLLPTGELKTVDKSFFDFSYRWSKLKTNNIIVTSAIFQTELADKSSLLELAQDIISQRKAKHPATGVGCAGSFFKNLPPLPGQSRRRAAGALLEEAGGKMLSVGGASVFQKHANFIINQGSATASDVKELASKLKQLVQEKYGILLEEEILYIGR